MVLDFYKLAEQPFGVTPDPRFLYLSPTHRDAMASALYGINSGRGFTALIARPGMGKTTLIFELLRKVRESAKTVFIFQSQCGPSDLLRSLLTDLGIECGDEEDLTKMQSKLNQALLREASQGKRLVVVIDEAQNLDEPVLEAVRMLSNFETPREKLMHIMLAGQPQLAEKLASPRLVQLRQRISIVARLLPLNMDETRLYIEHRLAVAGYARAERLFTNQAFAMIAKYTEGIPRNINNLCFNAMSLGYVAKNNTIDTDIIREVLADLDLDPLCEGAPVAAKPETLRLAVPSLPLIETTRPSLGRWPLSLALPLAVALALGALLTSSLTRVRSQSAASLRDDKPVGLKPQTPPEPAHPASRSSLAQNGVALSSGNLTERSQFVTVYPGQTLFEITTETLGKYDKEVLAQLRNLNPWLRDPNHIEAGQKLVLPPVIGMSETIQPAAEHVRNALVVEPEKQ
jgi:type II secretory pathway predicted ATPase ExeA